MMHGQKMSGLKNNVVRVYLQCMPVVHVHTIAIFMPRCVTQNRHTVVDVCMVVCVCVCVRACVRVYVCV